VSNTEQLKIGNRVRISVGLKDLSSTGAVDTMSHHIHEQRSAPLDESIQVVVSDNTEKIAALAYRFWHERGSPIGSDQQDWFTAERELATSTSKIRDEDKVESQGLVEPSTANAEVHTPALRFPVRCELFESSHQRLLRRA